VWLDEYGPPIVEYEWDGEETAVIVCRLVRDIDTLLSALRTEAETIEAVDLIIREMPVPQNTNANWWKAQIYHIRTTIRATLPRIPTSGWEK
jgi:hypothetical protein